MIVCHGRPVPLITVVGSRGTGKSILAWRVAQLITRAVEGPNVLLVDADVYGGGLTAQMEWSAKSTCGYLHDVIVGRNPKIHPIDLAGNCLPSEQEKRFPEKEGRLFFLPGAREEASSPYFAVMNADPEELRKILSEAIANSAETATASLIVVDTASFAEPCAAVFAAVSDLVVFVAGNASPRNFSNNHLQGLQAFGIRIHGQIPVEVVFNKIPLTSTKSINTALPNGFYAIPMLERLIRIGFTTDDNVADRIDFDNFVVEFLGKAFRVNNAKLVPLWYAALPPEWRILAKTVKEPKLRFYRLLPTLIRLSWKHALLGMIFGLPGFACFLWAASLWRDNPSTPQFLLPLSVLTFGFVLLLVFCVCTIGLIRELVLSRAALVRLLHKDREWIIAHLRFRPGLSQTLQSLESFFQTDPPCKMRTLTSQLP